MVKRLLTETETMMSIDYKTISLGLHIAMKPIEVILNSFIASVNDKFNVNANLTPAYSSRKMHTV